MSMPPEPPRFVVCAAMRNKSGLIIAGARHFDTVMRAAIKSLNLGFSDWEQGFIDQKGVFMTREEAWKVADARGQIRRPTGWEPSLEPRKANVGDEGCLFSENLY